MSVTGQHSLPATDARWLRRARRPHPERDPRATTIAVSPVCMPDPYAKEEDR